MQLGLEAEIITTTGEAAEIAQISTFVSTFVLNLILAGALQ